jgi:uncharacterized membrane protein
MKTPAKPTYETIFRVAVVFKGIDAVLEIIGGVLLLLVSPQSINKLIADFTQNQLSENSHDFIATHLMQYSHLAAHDVVYGSIYLLAHGVLKLLLVVQVLRYRLWAYPAFILLLIAFIAYQLYRFSITGSILLAGLTVLDLIVAWLTYGEYRRLQRRLHESP